MRPEQEQKALDRPPHPMLGWLAAIPLPASHQPGPEPPQDPIAKTLEQFGMSVYDFHVPQPGIAAAVVVEVGPLPETETAELLVPFTAGATVYYSDDRGIEIGGYAFLRTDSVLAWEEAP